MKSISNVIIVVEDLAIMLEFVLLGNLVSLDLTKWRYRLIGSGFYLAGLGLVLIFIGDVAIMIGYENRDLWFLTRFWRAHPWRLAVVVGLAMALVALRFSTLFKNGGHGSKN